MGLNLSLRLSLKSHLHSLKSLAKVLLGRGEFLVLLSNALLNLLPDLGELQLAPQHLVLLLFQGALGLGQGGLQLHLLSLETLSDFVNLVDGATSLSDLVHDVLDLVGERLVLPPHLLKLEDSLLIGGLHLEQLRGSISGLLLAHIEVE